MQQSHPGEGSSVAGRNNSGVVIPSLAEKEVLDAMIQMSLDITAAMNNPMYLYSVLMDDVEHKVIVNGHFAVRNRYLPGSYVSHISGKWDSSLILFIFLSY